MPSTKWEDQHRKQSFCFAYLSSVAASYMQKQNTLLWIDINWHHNWPELSFKLNQCQYVYSPKMKIFVGFLWICLRISKIFSTFEGTDLVRNAHEPTSKVRSQNAAHTSVRSHFFWKIRLRLLNIFLYILLCKRASNEQ